MVNVIISKQKRLMRIGIVSLFRTMNYYVQRMKDPLENLVESIGRWYFILSQFRIIFLRKIHQTFGCIWCYNPEMFQRSAYNQHLSNMKIIKTRLFSDGYPWHSADEHFAIGSIYLLESKKIMVNLNNLDWTYVRLLGYNSASNSICSLVPNNIKHYKSVKKDSLASKEHSRNASLRIHETECGRQQKNQYTHA